MTRIIAGSLAGRKLQVPPSGTRPTTDRVREAIFNSLTSRMDFAGLYCIDLFAGSGALGFEALSRGAAQAYFIDSHSPAIRTLRQNATILSLDPIIRQMTVESYLYQTTQHPATTQHPTFDLVFCDPPYSFDNTQIAEILQTLTTYWLSPGAYIVLERAKRSSKPQLPEDLSEIYHKNYGDTAVYLLKYH